MAALPCMRGDGQPCARCGADSFPRRHIVAPWRRLFDDGAVIVGFDNFRLDLSRHTLWQDGQPVALTRQVFACLRFLVENRHRAVSREELMQAIWKRDNVSDAQLSNMVLRVRRVLGDVGETQGMIRTVVGFGYCWVAMTHVIADGDAPGGIRAAHAAASNGPTDVAAPQAPDAAMLPVSPDDLPVSPALEEAFDNRADDGSLKAFATARSFRRGAFAALVLVLVLASVMAVGVVSFKPSPRDTAVPVSAQMPPPLVEPRLAVLPLRVIPATAVPWAKLGGMDLLIERMRQAGLAVLPSESVLGLIRNDADEAQAMQQISQLPSIDMVVQGELRRDGEGHWQAHFVAKSEHQQLFAEGTHQDALQALELASSQLLAALGRNHMGADGDPALVGLIQRVRAALLAEAPDQARAILKEAAPQWQELPELRFHQAQVETRAGYPDQAIVILDAVLQDLRSAVGTRLYLLAHVARGVAHFRLGHGDAAIADFDIAIQSGDPARFPYALGEAHNGRGVVLLQRGDYDAALERFGQARVLLDASGDVMAVARVDANIGILDYRQGRYATAEQRFKKLLDQRRVLGDVNGQITALYLLEEIYLKQLRIADALTASDESARLTSLSGNVMVWRASALLRARILLAAGRLNEMEQLLAEVRQAGVPHGEAVQDDLRLAILDMDSALSRGDIMAARRAAAELPLSEDQLMSEKIEHHPLMMEVILLRQRIWMVTSLHERESSGWLTIPGVASDEGDTMGSQAPLLLLALAEWQWHQGRSDAADATYARAMTAAQNAGTPDILAKVVNSHVPRLLATGRLDEAQVLAAAIAAWADQHYDSALSVLQVAHATGSARGWRSALDQAKALAGERSIPPDLMTSPRVKPATPRPSDLPH